MNEVIHGQPRPYTMAYDASGGRSGEPIYFEDTDTIPEYTSNYPSEPRDHSPYNESTNSRNRASPSKTDRMTTSSRPAEPNHDDLIAEITERVKRELVEHLKQTGSIDEQPRAKSHSMQRESSTSSTTSSHPHTGRDTPPSPNIQSTRPANPMEYKSPPRSPLEGSVRFSDREPRKKSSDTPRAAPSRTYSTIDMRWGTLFDSQGIPTQRLGEFLRGLANHIVEDFNPKKSIVVTPVKMATYYANYPLEKEPHPLLSIFRAQSNENISQLYQDLGCQHHLVSEDPRKEPTIPALTPLGFAHWMTIQILAYPEEEATRLEKVVLALPIDGDGCMIDGKPERLPKQISRHLLPERSDRESKKILNDAIEDFLQDLGTASRRKGSITSPPLSRHSSTSQSQSRTRNVPVEIHQAKTSPKPSKAQPIERERKPYAGAPSDSSSTEDTVKIERERQPYSAQPGNGKIYTEKPTTNAPSLGRETSTTRTREKPEVREREPRHYRAQSTTSYVPPPRAGGSSSRRRVSSPPPKSFSNSTPADIDATSKYGPPPSSSSSSFTSQGLPGSYGSASSGPTSFPPPPPPMEIRNPNPNRMSRDERQYTTRRPMDDESRLATGEFNSPRDAERWDRYQETATGGGRDAEYGSRGSVAVDPLDPPPAVNTRGAPSEDWYRDSRDREREKNRSSAYYGTRGGY